MKEKSAFILIWSLALFSLNCSNSASSGTLSLQMFDSDTAIIRQQEEAYEKTVAKLNSINMYEILT